jgi:hypothetical protein
MFSAQAKVAVFISWWTASGDNPNPYERWDVTVLCQEGSGSTELSWTFPALYADHDSLEILVSPLARGPESSHAAVSEIWTYTYEWQP